MLLCMCIVFCNGAVILSLCYKEFNLKDENSLHNNKSNQNYGSSNSKIKKPVLAKKVSRTISKMSTTSTREEVAFGRLMGFLCIIFIVCWMPQLVCTYFKMLIKSYIKIKQTKTSS